MKAVFKYQLAIADEQTLQIPAGAQLLSVAEQRQQLCLWALVDDEVPLAPRRIRVAGTGHSIEGAPVFLGTVLLMGGDFVAHVFEVVT